MTQTTQKQNLIAQIKALRPDWSGCIDTAEDAAREADAREAEEACEEAWDSVLEALEEGDFSAANQELEAAKLLCKEWGDGTQVVRAIDLLEQLRSLPTCATPTCS